MCVCGWVTSSELEVSDQSQKTGQSSSKLSKLHCSNSYFEMTMIMVCTIPIPVHGNTSRHICPVVSCSLSNFPTKMNIYCVNSHSQYKNTKIRYCILFYTLTFKRRKLFFLRLKSALPLKDWTVNFPVLFWWWKPIPVWLLAQPFMCSWKRRKQRLTVLSYICLIYKYVCIYSSASRSSSGRGSFQ